MYIYMFLYICCEWDARGRACNIDPQTGLPPLMAQEAIRVPKRICVAAHGTPGRTRARTTLNHRIEEEH